MGLYTHGLNILQQAVTRSLATAGVVESPTARHECSKGGRSGQEDDVGRNSSTNHDKRKKVLEVREVWALPVVVPVQDRTKQKSNVLREGILATVNLVVIVNTTMRCASSIRMKRNQPSVWLLHMRGKKQSSCSKRKL